MSEQKTEKTHTWDRLDRLTHLVIEDAKARDDAMQAGTPVGSVCGKVWVPSREPNAFPLCAVCVEHIRRGWMA